MTSIGKSVYLNIDSMDKTSIDLFEYLKFDFLGIRRIFINVGYT